ncbi:MAG: hypothetical protein AMJ43_08120 [Coxiella sp. DG_40]|nr:MAG: hypothetical protein AMJ43_08120 [Coxiella sp. DG_40]
MVETIATGIGGEQFGFSSGVFSAVQGAERIDSADKKTLLIGGQKRARNWQAATGTAAPALSFAFLVDRQYTGNGPL